MNKIHHFIMQQYGKVIAILCILVLASGINYREWHGEALNINNYRITGFKNSLAENSTEFLPTQWAVNQAILGISSVGNPYDVISVRSYFTGTVTQATVVGVEDTARGTNITPFIQAALNAARPGQMVFLEAGEWVTSTPLDSFKLKQVNLVIYGNTHHNKRSFIRIGQTTGAFKLHMVRHYGMASGRENMASHTKATHDAGTQPNWAAMTNIFAEVIDNSQNFIQAWKVTAFGTAFQVSGYLDGSQENTFVSQFLYKNGVGYKLYSKDGSSYCDKNTLTGPNGGIMRISGGLALECDGNSAVVSGDQYNGAFRSNRYVNLLLEQLDSAVVFKGDVTEPIFDKVVLEGGVSTGVFGTTFYKFYVYGGNYIRSPKFHDCGVLNTTYFQSGFAGYDGSFLNCSWWYNGAVYLGNEAYGDKNGNIIISCAASLAQSTRSAVPSIFRFRNEHEEEKIVSNTASTYTVPDLVRHLKNDNAAGTVTLPAASSFPTREITIYNQNGNPLTMTNTGLPIILGGHSNTFFSDGVNWLTQGEIGEKYTMAYSNTSNVSVNNTATQTTVLSGVGSLIPPVVPDGTEYHFRATGTIGTSGTTDPASITFDLGNYTQVLTFGTQLDALPTGMATRDFEIEFSLYISAGRMEHFAKVTIDNSVQYYSANRGGLGVTFTPTTANMNVRWKWNTANASNVITFYTAKWEIIRPRGTNG